MLREAVPDDRSRDFEAAFAEFVAVLSVARSPCPVQII